MNTPFIKQSGDKMQASAMTSLPFTSPCTAIISGPTASGKSTFTFRMLQNLKHMFDTPVKKIYCFYGVWQRLFEINPNLNVEYIRDIPNEQFLQELDIDNHNLVIIDDLQSSALNNGFIANLFSREAHHRNPSVFLILQNLFHQGKYSRDISLNTHYFILFKNQRDINQIKILGNQLGIGNKLVQAYSDVTSEPFSYVLIDLSPQSNTSYMLRSNIFPHEYAIVYK